MFILRSSRIQARAFSLALITMLLSTCVPSMSRASCDGSDHLSWRWGRTFYHYDEGDGLQGVLDLAKVGNVILATEADWGPTIYLASPDGELTWAWSNSGHAYQVEAGGNFAYIAYYDEGGGLRVLDISDPAHPAYRGSIPTLTPESMTLGGNYLYASTGSQIQVVSIEDPWAPTIVATIVATAGSMLLFDDYLYATGPTGLRAIDVSDPLHPMDRGIVRPGSAFYGLARVDDYLYVSDGSFGLRVFDVSFPAAPVMVASLPIANCSGLVAGSSRALVSLNFGEDFVHVDTSDPLAPVLGGIFRGVTVVDGAIDGDFAYLACWEAGLQVFSLGDGGSPAHVHELSAAANLRSLHSLGSYVVGVDNTRLVVLDAADPSTPTIAATLPMGYTYSLEVQGSTGYVLGDEELRIIDLGQPNAPAIVSTIPIDNRDLIAVSGNRLYLTWYAGPTSIFDITVPQAPVLLSEVDLTYGVGAIAALGTQLFHAVTWDATCTVTQIDLTDPTNPQYVDGSYSLYPIANMTVSEGTLFAASLFGVYAMEIGAISDNDLLGALPCPYNPILAIGDEARVHTLSSAGGFHTMSGLPLEYSGSGATSTRGGKGIAEVSGHLYVTDSAALWVYPIACAPAAIPELGSGRPLSSLRVEPNPTSGLTRLVWQNDGSALAHIALYDTNGRLIREWFHSGGRGSEGARELMWDGLDARGAPVGSGVFLARVTTVGHKLSGRVILVR